MRLSHWFTLSMRLFDDSLALTFLLLDANTQFIARCIGMTMVNSLGRGFCAMI